jgi:CheY-like chemotaxis protein
MGAEAPVQQRSPDAGVTGSTDEGPVVDRDRLVIVADPDVEAGKSTVAKLFAWGLHPILVHDGVEAMLTIQRMLPRVVVLDAALPKMYGFQVCEVIKRNESLRHTGVVLVGAIHNQDRYRRQPAELYGADYYIEQPDLPEGLEPLFVQMGVTLSAPGTNATPAPPPTPEPAAPPAFQPPPEQSSLELPPEQPSLELPPEQPSFETAIEPAEVAAPVQAPPAQAQPSVDPVDELAEERAKAERLARIIVSDIALYQPEKFGQAVASGKVIEVMDSQIEEGRVLFAQRVDERVRAERDFIVDELLRVARERGMQ